MSAWQRALDEMKREAHRNTIADPRFFQALGKEARETGELVMTPELAAKVKKLNTVRVIRGWQLILSRSLEPDKSGEPGDEEQLRSGSGKMIWHLSAQAYPKGRPVQDDDWRRLGYMLGHLGAPKEPLFWPASDAEPRHWRWEDPDVEREAVAN